MPTNSIKESVFLAFIAYLGEKERRIRFSVLILPVAFIYFKQRGFDSSRNNDS